MSWAPAVVVITVTLTACTPTQPADSPTTTSPVPTSTTVVPAAVPDCLAGTLPFAAQGIAAALDSPRPDATTIGGIRWQGEEECERIVIEFLGDGGSPATRLGPVGVTVAPDSGIVRISLPDEVEASAIGDSVITGSLVDRIYVVEGIEDGLVVDVHLAARAAARAFTTSSPSRLVVDLRPISDDPLGSAPDTGDGVVVASPLPGPGLYPVQVVGYAAPGVEAVSVTLTDGGGVVVSRSVSTATDQYVWRAFAVTISDGPSGTVELRVFTDAADDDGVVIELDLP